MAGRKKLKEGAPKESAMAQASIHERVAGLLALTLTDQLVGLIKTVDGIKALTNAPNAVKVFEAALASLGGKGTLTIHASDAVAPTRISGRGGARKGPGGQRKKKTISEAGKQAIRLAQLKRWRKIKRAGKRSAKKS